MQNYAKNLNTEIIGGGKIVYVANKCLVGVKPVRFEFRPWLM